MNKSTLSQRRNMPMPSLSTIKKNLTVSAKIEEQKPLRNLQSHKIFTQNLSDNQNQDQPDKNQMKSSCQIPLFSSSNSSAKVKNMINQASQMYASQKHPFEANFVVEQKLGQGAHGIVKKCYHKDSKKVYAVKILKMQDQHFRSIKTNFINIKQLKNQHIIKYKALYLSSKTRLCHLVMEYLPYKRLHKGLDQTVLRIIFHKIITSLAYIHEKGICHRDLKPDNILFDQKSRCLKIIDFGVSKNMKLRGKYEAMLTNTGQLYYKAPQMFEGGSYTEKVDSWAIGVTLYQLIVGKTPFEDQYMIETIHNIQSKPLDFEDENFKRFNPIVKDLIAKLLQRDVKKRLTCKQAAMHFWFLPHLQNVDLMKSAGYSFDFLQNLEIRTDLSVGMSRGYSVDINRMQDQKFTKGQKVVMKSWLEMIREDQHGLNQQEYKFQFVQSQSEGDQNPFDKKSPIKAKSKKNHSQTEANSPLLI